MYSHTHVATTREKRAISRETSKERSREEKEERERERQREQKRERESHLFVLRRCGKTECFTVPNSLIYALRSVDGVVLSETKISM